MSDSDFDPWLGKIGHDKSLYNRLTKLARRYNFDPTLARGRRVFNGSRIGRGAGIGRVLRSAAKQGPATTHRASVSTYVIRFRGPHQAYNSMRGHLYYLQRNGAGRSGERGRLYSNADVDEPTVTSFARSASNDRHQFRLIVDPDDEEGYESLQPLVRRLVRQASEDLRAEFDWLAADHYDARRTHSHVVIRGKTHDGADLIIAPEYLRYGFVARTREIVSIDLGPPLLDLAVRRHELAAERMTPLDRRLLQALDETGHLSMVSLDHEEERTRTIRLRMLADRGLAMLEPDGRWWVDQGLDHKLELISERNREVGVIALAMRTDDSARPPSDFAWRSNDGEKNEITGRLVSFTQSVADGKMELIVDGIDGRVHFAEVADAGQTLAPEMIVRVSTMRAPAAAIVAPSPLPSEPFMSFEPSDSGSSENIGPKRPNDSRIGSVCILSRQPLAQLPNFDGMTWLDSLLVDPELKLQGGFGVQVGHALDDRLTWLEAKKRVRRDRNQIILLPAFAARLRAYELANLRRRSSDRDAADNEQVVPF